MMAAAGVARGETTVSRTIGDANQDNVFDFRPGEAYRVRQDLAAAVASRSGRRVPRLTFAQFTDTHVVDEESPLRFEFLDQIGAPLTSAYRPQEGLSPHVLNEMVRQVRAAVSPVSSRRVDLVMTTGDNSDNSQRNEVRDVIDLMDGGDSVAPDSGLPDTCGLPDEAKRYDGVRGGGAYYEPDRSNAGEDGPGYSSNAAANLAAVQRSNRLRDFPGLFEAMNIPFPAAGLGVPWYGVFGNHDGLIQGNQPRNEALEAVAVGCVKVTALSPAALASVKLLAAGGITPAENSQIYRLVTEDVFRTAADPTKVGTLSRIVPSDPTRRPLKKVEYMQEHFRTRGTPVGHGFTSANLASGMGNFSFQPKPGLRFIVLDTINEAGYSDGNIDDEQFRWIHAQLIAAEARSELVALFAHHSLRTMNQPAASPFPAGDTGGNLSPLVHFGLGQGSAPADCTITDPNAATSPDETLRCLFLRHPGVVAFIAGHEHLNRIVPYPRPATGAGGFWEITTSSHIDWPQQSRMLDLFDNRDGTWSLFTTILDHEGAIRPAAAPSAPINPTAASVLAGISRELSFNDPQADNGENGHTDARGTALDRNVELLIKGPYAAP